MRRLAFLAMLTGALVFQAVQIADACGDKFLLVGRGIKFQRGYAAVYHANILLYSAPGSVRSVMEDNKFHDALKAAGHQVTVVHNPGTVKSAFTTGSYDVVLAELTQAEQLGTEADFKAAKTIVLPVVQKKPTKAE